MMINDLIRKLFLVVVHEYAESRQNLISRRAKQCKQEGKARRVLGPA
jgi:hypothetical protein